MDFGFRTDTLTNKSAFGGKADMEKRYSTFGKSLPLARPSVFKRFQSEDAKIFV